MKKTESVTQNYVFRAAYRRGRNVPCKNMVVYAWKSHPKTVNRLGLTVSVKLGCAVERNRIHRRLREAYRLMEDKLNAGYTVIIVARSNCLAAPFDELQRDMRSAFEKLGVVQ